MTDQEKTTGRMVVGMFNQREAAEGAIRDLKGAGFSAEQIDVTGADARHTDQDLWSGAVLVTVDAGPRTEEALAILDRHGTGRRSSRSRGPRAGERETTADAVAAGTPGTAGVAAATLGDPAPEQGTGAGSSAPHSAWEGLDRRRRHDPAYTGPERRLARV